MAAILCVITKVGTDSRNRKYALITDIETNQYCTMYPRKDQGDSLLDNVKVTDRSNIAKGTRYVVSGTISFFPARDGKEPGLKFIATSLTPHK